MFLFARLVVATLVLQINMEDFRREAENLPHGLDEA